MSILHAHDHWPEGVYGLAGLILLCTFSNGLVAGVRDLWKAWRTRNSSGPAIPWDVARIVLVTGASGVGAGIACAVINPAVLPYALLCGSAAASYGAFRATRQR
jgi:hypothetical protein